MSFDLVHLKLFLRTHMPDYNDPRFVLFDKVARSITVYITVSGDVKEIEPATSDICDEQSITEQGRFICLYDKSNYTSY